jgi:predicted NBD/HSP70 family sugar kinase
MRKIDPGRFQIATQGTSREINRQIVLNLVRANQPISRADLARTMGVRRGSVSLIVNELLESGLIVEGATGKTDRGRKPTFLYIDSQRRTVIAVDIRATQTFLMLADLLGKPLSGVIRFSTVREPKELIAALAVRIRGLLEDHGGLGACEGVGVAIPGLIEHATMRVLHAPQLGWRDVDLREPLAAAVGLPVQIENSGRACALAQLWAMHSTGTPGSVAGGDLIFVTVSDGVGLGVVVHGELLRGRHNVAGEFGHVPLSLNGPRCSCGATGCWEAYVSNRATLARYFGRPAETSEPIPAAEKDFTIEDLIARARGGDSKARAAIQATGRYLGAGLVSVVTVFDPARIYVGGEITAAWDLIELDVRAALAERALTPAAAATEIRPVAASEYPRLQGAAALFNATAFAAPVVA